MLLPNLLADRVGDGAKEADSVVVLAAPVHLVLAVQLVF